MGKMTRADIISALTYAGSMLSQERVFADIDYAFKNNEIDLLKKLIDKFEIKDDDIPSKQAEKEFWQRDIKFKIKIATFAKDNDYYINSYSFKPRKKIIYHVW